jgi:DNA excision repair protein ERCC-5
MEAEAQCAQLDAADLTQGTITDDSDVWLFGGKRVYKNFFYQDKHVEFFSEISIKSQLGDYGNKIRLVYCMVLTAPIIPGESQYIKLFICLNILKS